MINENVENMKADAKNAVSDIGNIMSHAKADAKADVEKVKAKFGHGDKLEKKAAYAKADIKANASKAKADVKNRITHLEADAEKTKAD
jgi:F0F1-type ATP synthase membrane subunit b/b'